MKSRLCLVSWGEKAKEAKYSVRGLARLVRCSVNELERFFLEEMKMCPHAWMTRLRNRQAMAELREGIPIKEVAFHAGYANAAHLSREFKKVHGISPAEAAYGRPKRTKSAMGTA